ncbi:PAS domain S-box protein [Desulfobulbus alkaliphilus]|uniref:PAS domain S-box protein n=1 Tax=Desulfobulbus alkaliphilus TaxID=869814 RepID=UPI0019649CAA|nr:PAS domain S-box protein [Desulfobulbus alkaliphilus]MBM9536090.1 PAS domain S-box protein [Desulfobulbus alkaliphilus]
MSESTTSSTGSGPMPDSDLEDLFMRAPVGVFTSTPEGRYISVNPATAKMLGYDTRQELIESVTDMATQVYADPVDRRKFMRLMEEQGEVVNHECRFRRRDGTELWVSSNVHAVRGEDGQIVAHQGFYTDVTARKKAEESEEKYRLIFNMGVNAMFLVDNETTQILECNTKASQLFGYTPEKLVSMQMADLSTTPEATRQACRVKVSKQERVYRKKDGRLLSVEVTSEHFYLANRAVHIAAIEDITEKKQTEKALKESEERFHLAMDATRDGVYEWDLETRKIYYSPGWKRMLGYEPHELPDDFSVWEKLTRPEDVEKSWQIMREVLKGKRERFEVEFQMRHKDGHWMHILSRANIFKNATGKPDRVIGTHVDITESKHQTERLRLSESRYKKAQALAKVGIWEYNPQTGKYWGSDEARKIFGFDLDKESFSAEEVESCIVERARVHQAMVDLIENGKPGNLEYDIITKNTGQLKNIFSMAEIEQNRVSDSVRISGVILDITERKRYEQQLATALSEKEVLLREIHHRVKNNLAAIISLMDMQRRTLEDPNGQVIFTELSNRIRSMSLVHEKLYRADSLATIDFHDYTQALISHLRTTFGSPEITCLVDAPGSNIPLDLASPCGLIVNELVTNALKYAFPEGKPRPGNNDCRILVSFHRDKDTYTLTVADNGIGWPPGFDWTETKTLGMTLVRMLGRHQLGGQYVVDQDNGTSITLTFTDRKKGDSLHG